MEVVSRKTGTGPNKVHKTQLATAASLWVGDMVMVESTALGEPNVSMNKIKVVGARRIWGTLRLSKVTNFANL